jgi:hypothetical protein
MLCGPGSLHKIGKVYDVQHIAYLVRISTKAYFFFSLTQQPQFGPWPTSMKLSVSLRLSRL